MLVDVYEQISTRNPNTGQQERSWSYDRTLRCQARGVISEGLRTVGSNENFRTADRTFTDEDWVKVRTSEQVSKRAVLHNIRMIGSDESAWIDVESGDPIYFEVLGSQPIIGPFGRTTEFETHASRRQDTSDIDG